MKDIQSVVQFWDAAERQVLVTLVEVDPLGFEKSLEDRALVSWMRRKVDEANEHAFGIPWQAVLAVKVNWKRFDDKDPGLIPFDDTWRDSKEGAASLIAKFR